MSNLENISISKLLPPNLLLDKNAQSLAFVIDKQLDTLHQTIINTIILPRVDELNHAMLDILAIQYNAPFYDQVFSLEQKRELIKSAISVHKQNGTIGAVERALKSVFTTGCVKEWHEYDGLPYHFKISMDGSRFSLGENHVNQIKSIVASTKNIRSRLEEIEINFNHHTQANMGIVASMDKITMITPSQEVTINVSNNYTMYTGSSIRTSKTVIIGGL